MLWNVKRENSKVLWAKTSHWKNINLHHSSIRRPAEGLLIRDSNARTSPRTHTNTCARPGFCIYRSVRWVPERLRYTNPRTRRTRRGRQEGREWETERTKSNIIGDADVSPSRMTLAISPAANRLTLASQNNCRSHRLSVYECVRVQLRAQGRFDRAGGAWNLVNCHNDVVNLTPTHFARRC